MSSSSDGASGVGDMTAKRSDRLRVIIGGAHNKTVKTGSGAQVVLVYSVDRKLPLEKQFHDLPVDKEKVEDIKRRLADGSLRINADKIAEKLIEKNSLNG